MTHNNHDLDIVVHIFINDEMAEEQYIGIVEKCSAIASCCTSTDNISADDRDIDMFICHHSTEGAIEWIKTQRGLGTEKPILFIASTREQMNAATKAGATCSMGPNLEPETAIKHFIEKAAEKKKVNLDIMELSNSFYSGSPPSILEKFFPENGRKNPGFSR